LKPLSRRGFGARKKENRLAPKVLVVAAMHKLVHFIYGMVQPGKPFLEFMSNGHHYFSLYLLRCVRAHPNLFGTRVHYFWSPHD
jgi:hypothetical protein